MKSGWQTRMLADVCEVFADGDWVESKDQSPEGIRLIQTGNVGEGVFKDRGEKARYISEATLKRLRCTEIFEGDSLISRLPDPVGRSCLLPDTGERMITAVDCTIVRLNPKQLLSEFFNFYSQSLDYLKAVGAETTGTTRSRISRSKLGQVVVPVPPLPEQQRIVGVLDEAFEGIATAKANAEKNLQNVRALFDSHLQGIFTQRGEGWVEEFVGSLCDVKHGFAFDGAAFSGDVPDGNPLVITPGNFTEDGRLLFNERNTKRLSGSRPVGFLFDVGDLVIVMTDLSSKMKILGKPAFIETDNVLHNQRIGRVVFSNDHIEKRFLYYFMMTELFLKNIKESATGTMVKHTAPRRILSNVIPFPRDRRTQRAIINKLDSLRAETQSLASVYERKLAALEALKKSLLHQAFSGQL